MARILVVVELREGGTPLASASAIAFASRLAELGGGDFVIGAFGPGGVAAAEQLLLRYGASRVYVCEGDDLSRSSVESYVPTVTALAQQCGASIIVAAASSWGKDVMPRVAAELDAGYISDCVDASLSEGKFEYAKPMYAGNVVGACVVESPVAVISVRQSAVAPAQPLAARSSELVPIELEPLTRAASRVEVLDFELQESERPDLAEARRVVAGGRGIGARFFELLEPLAIELDAAIGASRAACDFEYAPGALQVGQTGTIIAPDLYVAVGISGAVQHTAGIRGAKVVVAIDKDPEAPILSIANYALVADAFEAVPALVAELRRRKETPS